MVPLPPSVITKYVEDKGRRGTFWDGIEVFVQSVYPFVSIVTLIATWN